MADAEIRVITGPTAAGKSALALDLAERYDAVLISADSRQIYRGFDIGTAKPSLDARLRVPHRGIDIVDPSQRYSAALWAASAATWIEETRAAGQDVVIVGGTGFYLRALFAPLFSEPYLDPELRAGLQLFFQGVPLEELRRWCAVLDPDRAHLGRTQLLRAVEVALLSGERLSSLHARGTRPAPWRARYLVVDPGAVLRERIAARVDAMLEAGWIAEVRALSVRVPPDAPAWNAAGYQAIREAAAGDIGLDIARERVIVETRQYAKRQRTWLRHQLDASSTVRIDPERPDAHARAEQWWEGGKA